MRTLEEKIDLMVRFLDAQGWSVWISDDDDLLELRHIHREAYEANRHRSFTTGRMEADRAVLRKVFEQET